MYNMQFGESIFIEDNYEDYNNCYSSSGFLVDFGSLASSELINKQYENIFFEMKNQSNPEALISHFHKDHYSGFFHFAERKKYKNNNIFEHLYIPDIFSLSSYGEALSLVLIDFLLNNIEITNNKIHITLLQFVNMICGSSKKLTLLKQGDIFRNYVVLSPSPENVIHCSKKIFTALPINHQIWINLSHTIMDIINSKVQSEEQISELFYRNPLERYDSQTLISDIMKIRDSKELPVKINSFGHTANIVFQSQRNDDSAVLFTGDAEIGQLKKLESWYYDHYAFYKIPHHGTKNHFYNKIDSDIQFLSNGKYRNYYIDNRYCQDSLLKFCCNCSNRNKKPSFKCKHCTYSSDIENSFLQFTISI